VLSVFSAVMNVYECCSHRMRHFQQGRWKILNSLFIMLVVHRMVVFFPILGVSIFEINYNKHSTVFSNRLLSLFANCVVRMRTRIILLLFKNGGWQNMMHFLVAVAKEVDERFLPD